MAAPDIVTTVQGDTLDGALWRERGLGPADLPAVLDANRGLGALGPVLPVGTPIIVPPSAPASPIRPFVQLWD